MKCAGGESGLAARSVEDFLLEVAEPRLDARVLQLRFDGVHFVADGRDVAFEFASDVGHVIFGGGEAFLHTTIKRFDFPFQRREALLHLGSDALERSLFCHAGIIGALWRRANCRGIAIVGARRVRAAHGFWKRCARKMEAGAHGFWVRDGARSAPLGGGCGVG
jgi:hypothetical protein